MDNSWLDEVLQEAPVVDRGRQSHKVDKRKKPQISEGSDSSDEHGGGSSTGGGGVGASSAVYGSGSGGFSGGGGYGSVGSSISGSGGHFGCNVYQRGYERDYRPSDLHESYHQQYDSHDSYNPLSTSEIQPSSYDNLIVSFFGPSQMQYSYPPYHDAMQEGDDNVQNSFEPHRSSFWW